ncbi:MAG: hypothetical protein PHH54_04235 [Candidatus Nanoarchaeia archaeon]|nr:hypothetical protein [Candidatus Nanoarchaeia archaeon]MDD5741169.1 hypothetical protein [Candidatus Nanoarchaeia archaeon]
MITNNERKVLKMLLYAFGESYSINRIAKECKLAPNGALKILRKFEKEGILDFENIGNMKSYSLNFEDEKTKNILRLALIPELKARLKYRAEDLKHLKEFTEACIIFGSYADLRKEPNDIDLFFIVKNKKFNDYKKESPLVYKTMPIKVHDILQTNKDVAENLKKKDKVIIEILKTGIILWGYDKIINIIENGYKK